MSSNLPSCVIEPLVESTNLFLNNNENFLLAFFADKQSYLIKKLDKNLEIKVLRNGIFILNKLTGHVYFQSVYNKEIKKLENFGMIFDKEIHLLKFTIEDPIKQIITKYSNYFAMISKSGNAYLFSLLDNDVKQGLIPKYLFEDEKIVQIACGGVHVLFLTENNKLFGTGGELDSDLMVGNKIYGTTTKLTTFNIHDIEQLECGGYHSIIVSKSNDVYFSGSSHCSAIPSSKEYTKINFSEYISNWNNIQNSTKIKVETGFDFTLIYNENHKKNIFNFNKAYKISDITFHF
ncbi:hypothetical protein ABK040_012223 [Willaertia magna]